MIAQDTAPKAQPDKRLATNRLGIPALGFGLGLRRPHYAHILKHRPAVDWFEVISENYLDTHGKARRILDDIRAHYPIVMHGVSLSIGTVDPLNSEYLRKLRRLSDELQPAWLSDHLCWTGVAHKNTHDLLPVPYTEEALAHIIDRIKAVQDALSRPLCLENPSTYLEFLGSSIPEAEFIARMADGADCGLLLDVNNVYVTCFNHRLDPKAYLDTLPLDRVAQIHLAGHTNKGTHIVDTHDEHVVDEVWELYRYVVRKAGLINTMVEWDSQIPDFPVLFAELEKARAIVEDTTTLPRLPSLARDLPPVRPNAPLVLAEAEEGMQAAILAGDMAKAEPARWIRPKPDFAPAMQLQVYVDAYRIRLREVTEGDFPILKKFLGAGPFDALISDYVEATPSVFYDAGRYAAGFVDFLRKEGAAPFAIELATLEAAIGLMPFAEDSLPLTPQDLAGFSPEALMAQKLPLRAGTRLFAFEYPVQDFYRMALAEDSSPTEPAREASFLALYRHDETNWRLSLTKAEHALLTALQNGRTVGEALETLVESGMLDEESLLTSLSGWFTRWMQNGLLAALTPSAHGKVAA